MSAQTNQMATEKPVRGRQDRSDQPRSVKAMIRLGVRGAEETGGKSHERGTAAKAHTQRKKKDTAERRQGRSPAVKGCRGRGGQNGKRGRER